MAKPFILSFGSWMPDGADIAFTVPFQYRDTQIPCADVSNVYYAQGSYRSLPSFVQLNVNSAIPAQCVGAFTATDSEETNWIYLATASHIYQWSGLVFNDVTGPANHGNAWSFGEFGSYIYAANGADQLQRALSGNWATRLGTTFSAIGGSPIAKVVGAVGQFLMVGNLTPAQTFTIGTGNGAQTVFNGTATLTGPIKRGSVKITAGSITGTDDGNGNITGTGITTGSVNYGTGAFSVTFSAFVPNADLVNAFFSLSFPSRVQWSAIGDPTNWPTPNTQAAEAVESSYEDLDGDLGPVMAIAGYPLYAIILQQSGITRGGYQGGDVVFSFAPYERKRGLIAQNAWVQVGNVVHFIAADGFFMTDGANVVPTGTNENAALDKWFWSNVNQSALEAIRAGWDADKRCVAFAIPTGTNTLPDTLLLLSPESGRWTKAPLSSEFIFTDRDATTGRQKLGIVNQSHALGYLIGAAPSGYCETYDIGFTDQQVRHVSEAQPHIICTDSPTMRVAAKEAADDATVYTADVARDSFTKSCPFDTMPGGKFVRARVTSSAASAISGCTLELEQGAGV